MEKGTMIGLVMALVGVFLGAIMKGADIVMLFTNIPALLIVIVGSIGAVIISFPFADSQKAGKYLSIAMKGAPEHSASETIQQIVTLTSRARAEGLLALEEEAKKIDDPFFRKGIELAVDGTDPEALRKTLHADIAATKERHKVGQNWFTQAGVFSPTFGIIGAVFGLMATMGHLSEPEKIGHGIAAAFVATFWGVFLANGVWLPFANKLKRISGEEIAHKQLVVEGIMAIQAGVSPRVVEELLKSHVPPSDRSTGDQDGAGAGEPEAAAA
jgi:chemotaxis protein MotA